MKLSTHQRRRRKTTRAVTTNPAQDDALHDARTRRCHQSTHKQGKAADTRGVTEEEDQTLQQKNQKITCYDWDNQVINPSKKHHRTVKTREIHYFTRAETRHRHPTPDPSVRSPSCTNSSANASSGGLQPTPDIHQSVDQAGFRPGYSTTDHMYNTNFNSSDRAAEWHQAL